MGAEEARKTTSYYDMVMVFQFQVHRRRPRAMVPMDSFDSCAAKLTYACFKIAREDGGDENGGKVLSRVHEFVVSGEHRYIHMVN